MLMVTKRHKLAIFQNSVRIYKCNLVPASNTIVIQNFLSKYFLLQNRDRRRHFRPLAE